METWLDGSSSPVAGWPCSWRPPSQVAPCQLNSQLRPPASTETPPDGFEPSTGCLEGMAKFQWLTGFSLALAGYSRTASRNPAQASRGRSARILRLAAVGAPAPYLSRGQESPLGTGSNGVGINALLHRRAPVGSGRPSACHGCAVACIGQPPPPSAPGPVWGRWAQLFSRGCGGAAAFSRDGPGGRPDVCARDCAAVCSFQAEHGPSVDYLPNRQRMALLCVDPLLRSGSARFRVLLYW